MSVNELILKDISLSFGDNVLFSYMEQVFKPGIYVFSGPSGVGKTTLMRMIAGLEKRYTGTITLNFYDNNVSVDPFGVTRSIVLSKTNPNVHMVHQHYTSFPMYTCLDNVLMVHKGHGVKPKTADKEEALQMLERLGIGGENAKKIPCQLSGGQDQRLSLASAFVNRWSRVMLYDEPTSALDDLNDMLIVELIKEHQAKYQTIEIVITHEQHVVDGLMSDSNNAIIEFSPEFRIRKKEEATLK